MRLIILSTLIILSLTSFGYSNITKFIADYNISHFEKGKLEDISINRDGYLSLSPKKTEIFAKDNLLFIWTAQEDKNGNIYIGTGNKAQIYKISPSKDHNLIYEHKGGVSINSLAIDSKGNIYAAVNPENIIVKITPDGKSTTFATLKEKYIWRLKIDSKDNLYVATGNDASIYQFSPDGTKKMIYTTKEESHFLAMAINKNEDLYFASEGKGILYRYNKQGDKVQVLYDTYEDEIKDIVFDSKNNIYIATATKIPRRPPYNFDYTDTFVKYGSYKGYVNKRQYSKKLPIKNSVYKILENGEVQKLFTRDDTIFLSMAIDQDDKLYVGSGDDGVIYKIDDINVVSIFINADEAQILHISIDKNNQLIVTTGNTAKVYKLDLSFSNTGTYHSRIFDATGMSLWGKLIIEKELFQNTEIQFYTRTGNTESPDNTWSPWNEVQSSNNEYLVNSPSSQYIQYKAVLKSTNKKESPILKRVIISFLLENRAPRIDQIRLTKEFNKTLQTNDPFISYLPASVYTLSWQGSDSDNDYLTYNIYFREENSNNWVLLKDDLSETSFSFDSRKFPDGKYYFKVIVSDEKSNGKERLKTGYAESSAYLIDNTPPYVTDIKIKKENSVYKISGKAKDKLSIITIIQYSFNGSEWIYLIPKDNLYDSLTEEFEIIIPQNDKTLVKGKNIIILKVADLYRNFATYEVTFQND